MKNFLYLFLLIPFIGCKTNNFQTIQSHCQYEDMTNDDEKTFNYKKYDSILNIRNDTIKNNLFEIIEYSKYLDGEYLIRQTFLNTNIDRLIRYSSEGKILSNYSVYIDGYEKIGKEKHYNDKGIVIKTIDHEKGYKICYAEAIEIVKQKLKNKLSKYDSIDYVLERTDLNEHPEETPMWSVGVVPEPDDVIGETTYYKIDGVSGKYLGKYTLRMGKPE